MLVPSKDRDEIGPGRSPGSRTLAFFNCRTARGWPAGDGLRAGRVRGGPPPTLLRLGSPLGDIAITYGRTCKPGPLPPGGEAPPARPERARFPHGVPLHRRAARPRHDA